MSNVKHLLRKLHTDSRLDDHQRLADAGVGPTTSLNKTTSSSPSGSGAMGRITSVELAGGDRTAWDTGVNFNLLEEKFQVQLALAIRASDPNVREEAKSAQFDAAKQMSLDCRSTSVTETFHSCHFQRFRFRESKNHRGLQHYWGLRVRGQHTKTTECKGKTVGVSKKR